MQEVFSNASDDEIEALHKRVSSNIRQLRKEKGWGQMDLALEIGIKSMAFFSNCETNRYGKHFNIEHLYKISKALKIDISDFFEAVKSAFSSYRFQPELAET